MAGLPRQLFGTLPAPATHRADAELQQLLTEHYPQVFRLAWRLAGDRHEAEDIAHEVFIAAMNGWPEFRGDARFSTWIHRITVRIATRHICRRRRHAGDPDALEHLAGPDQAEDALVAAQISRAVAGLPLVARTVLALVVDEGLSHVDAAAVLGVPVGTIGSRLHAARRQLLQTLDAGAG